MLIFKLKPRPFKFFLLNRCKAYYIGPTIMSSSPLSDMQKKTKKTSMYSKSILQIREQEIYVHPILPGHPGPTVFSDNRKQKSWL